MTDIRFSCKCGTVHGRLTDVGPRPDQGTRIVCHCADCRGAAHWIDPTRDLARPMPYYQTTPDRLVIAAGGDRLAAMSWRNPKFLRWYASCCGTPLFNTPATPGVPFVSVYLEALEDPAPLGPVRGEAFVPDPKGGKPTHRGAPVFVWGLIRRSLPARLSGRWKAIPCSPMARRSPRRAS